MRGRVTRLRRLEVTGTRHPWRRASVVPKPAQTRQVPCLNWGWNLLGKVLAVRSIGEVGTMTDNEKPERNGDADLAAMLMREFGDPPPGSYLELDGDGNEIFVPQYMREMRAKRVADALLVQADDEIEPAT
jgi:hypothetical protein